MKKVYTLSNSILFVIILLLISCTDDTFVNDSSSHSTKLLFNVSQPLSRAIITDDDVSRLDLLIFKGGILEKTMLNITQFGETSDGYKSIDISFSTKGERSVYAIANMDNISWLSSLIVGTTTVEDILSVQTATLSRMLVPPLVMYGSCSMDFSTNISPVICNLYRSAARIDINNVAENFELLSARLLRSKAASYIFPSTNISKSELKNFESVEVENNKITLYSYENEVKEVDTSTTVEITGKVNGDSLVYIVDFSKNDILIPIGRNCKYTIDVQDVRSNKIETSINVRPWEVGETIDTLVTGSKPKVEVKIEPEVGTYLEKDSSFIVTSLGGQILMDVKANAECDIRIEADWIKVADDLTRGSSFIEGRFVLKVDENVMDDYRVAKITVFNKIGGESTNFVLTQEPLISTGDKYMVVVVAGQSNATGYDDSAIDLKGADAENPRAFQLSYRNGPVPNANLSIIPLTWCADDIDAVKRNSRVSSGEYGKRGIHLPLAKELIKYIPKDYKILVIPVSYTGSIFGTTTGVTPYGTFNSATLAPKELNTPLRWGMASTSAYAKTMIERTKYALDLDPRNKFLGVVWCQGENDKLNADYHYQAFVPFAEDVLKQLGAYADRTSYGSLDKRSWFCYSSCQYWVDWYTGDATGIFGGYKVWNPNTFIRIPYDTPSNSEGGTGGGKYHFGKGAFNKVIAPMVAARMNENGVLFNGVEGSQGHFTDKTNPTQAQMWGGSMSDEDVSSSLLLYMPFSTNATEKLTGNCVVYGVTAKMVQATGLRDIYGNERKRSVLALTQGTGLKTKYGPKVSDWSVSFLFKRTGSQSANIQTILTHLNGTGNTPFIGFKKFSPTMGTATYAEFVAEPILTTVKNNSIPGLFMYADKVRSMDDWIHYVVTFNASTRQATVYMNGEQVQQKVLSVTNQTDFTALTVGYASQTLLGAEGQMADLGLWSKVLTPATVRKLFLMSYYGYTK